MGKQEGNPKDFVVDQRVRYKPGHGVYGVEDAIGPDGRIPAVVVGHSPSMVRIRFEVLLVAGFKPKTVIRSVAAASLLPVTAGAA